MSDEVPPNLGRWPALVRRAVVGTQTARETLAFDADALAEFVDGAGDDDLALLRAAGVLALVRRAAVKPNAARTLDASEGPTQTSDAEDELERCSPQAASDLAAAFAASDRRLIAEWLAVAAHARVRIAEELLPRAFDYGAKERAARRAVVAVAGVRGRRVATLDPTWSYVLGESDFEAIWKFGEPAARVAVLAAERERDPVRAREALAAVWPSENAKTKGELLGALRIGLRDDDEPFLEAALDDGNKLVRAAAAELLATLPASRLTARAIALAGACVGMRQGLLRRELVVAPPTEFSPSMRRDAYVETAPGGVGQKSFRLSQIVARVPPAHWVRALGVAPRDAIELVAKNDYADALLSGFAKATAAFRDDAWGVAWLESAGDEKLRPYAAVACATLGRSGERRAALRALFDRREPEIARLAATYPAPWEDDLARSALAFARWMTEQKTFAWRVEFATLLDALAFRIDPSLPEAATSLPEEFAFEADARVAATFARTVAFRARIRSNLNRKDA